MTFADCAAVVEVSFFVSGVSCSSWYYIILLYCMVAQVLNYVIATCTYVQEVDFRDSFLRPFMLQATESSDSQVSCALYLKLILFWASFYDGNRIYWQVDALFLKEDKIRHDLMAT